MNTGLTREHAYIVRVGATASANNTHGIDGYYADGSSFEFKTLLGSCPSLGGKYVLENEHNIRSAIVNYLVADWFVVEVAEGEYLNLNKTEAVEWLMAHVSLTHTSSKRGGHAKLRINRSERTASATAKLLAEGYTLS
jgi:hypothetical protein